MDPRPRESLGSRSAGQMTALMHAASTGPRVLRIGVARGTRIVDERILRPRATVTIGFSESNTFVVADPNAPAACRLFEFSGGAYFLNTTGAMRGRVVTATGGREIDQPEPARIPLDHESRGKIVVGDVAFLFQFVIAPPAEARSQLPIAIVRTRWMDWKTTVIAAFSFMMHFAAIGSMYSDWFDPPMDDDIVVANVLDSVQPFAPALMNPETPEESPQATPENPGAAKGPPTSRKEPESAGNPGQKVAALGNAIERLQMSALGVLSTSGATADVLRSGEVPTGLLDVAARRHTGVGSPGLAIGGGAPLKPGAQGSGLATIGDTHGGGGGPGTTSTQKGPRGTVNASPPDVRGAPIRNAAAVIAGLRAGFRRCYERAIAIDPDTEGRIALALKVGPNGEVQSVGAVPEGHLSTTVVGCIRARAQAAQFDPPQGGLGAVVQVPVSLVKQQ